MYEYRTFDPFGGWDDLFRGFERFVQELDHDVSSAGYAPARITEENDKFVLRVELPGVAESDVRVEFDKGVLTVSAERKPEAKDGYSVRRKERAALRFERSFVLGDAADPEKIAAELKDGVLVVDIGKAATQRKRTIQVTSN